ncbi:MAG: RnfABCDGE type electron transport complex subunit D [Clostridia bacterium]|nr:RnfABCDGE type electron transport complex subunit D [Clostridia bacterium]
MQKMNVTSSPHISGPDNTTGIMLDVIIALLPATICGICFFGFNALLTVAVSVASAVLSEYLWCKAIKKQTSLLDLSAVVTGLLLGLNLPPTLPLWMAALGSAIAIVVVKQMFGGIGHNFANPAITARIALMVSFPTAMTTYIVPFTDNVVSSATPLGGGDFALSKLFFGIHPGTIGETSSLLLLAGGVYLVIRRVITPELPLAFMASAAGLAWALGDDPVKTLFTGGLMLGSIFMATDYVTSPPTRLGKIIFGVGCGLITVVIRHFGNIPEGVSFAILLMNILTPHITRLTAKKPFGTEGEQK